MISALDREHAVELIDEALREAARLYEEYARLATFTSVQERNPAQCSDPR